MAETDARATLQGVLDAVLAYRSAISERAVGPRARFETLVANIDPDGTLPDAGLPATQVVDLLIQGAEPGLTAMNGPRFFGWVIGGTQLAALGADWLTAAWDQNAGTGSGAPAAAAFEAVALRWVARLLGLPEASAALVTGATQANFVALASARHALLAERGWDAEQAGLYGAPQIRVLAGQERHEAVDKAVRLLGLGKGSMRFVATDSQGRLLPAALQREFGRTAGPWLLCTQAGNVNSGSFDASEEIAQLVSRQRELHGKKSVWWHVDGAFGLWASASSELKGLTRGVEHADSWATDAHKMLNVPYDCGIVITRHAAAHRRALEQSAPYLSIGEDAAPSFSAFTPELSRRARGFTLWAGLRALGARGLDQLVTSRHHLAKDLALRLNELPGLVVKNEVVFNQVVLGFREQGRAEQSAVALCRGLQREGTCYPTPTIWRGKPGIRFSVSSADTSTEDIARTADAVARVLGTL